jgi:hypothetical protein
MTDIFLTGTQGQSTDQPAGPTIPAIPTYDGQNLDGVIEALTGAVRQLSGHVPRPNNEARANEFLSGMKDASNNKDKKDGKTKSPPTPKDKDTKEQRFSEIERVTQDVKITNPQDKTQYVIVTQIVELTMQDNVTKEKWYWKL